MEKLYYRIPYVKVFDAVVTGCTEGKLKTGNSAYSGLTAVYEVTLDQTGFYPEGGGQPSDTGILGGRRVLEVHEKQGEILHYMDGPLEVGSQVRGEIDWDRRYSNMQQHTGEHLLSGLIHHHYGYDNVGFHMGEHEVTVDFNGPLTMEQLLEVEQEANRLIYENLPVNQLYPAEEELHRIDYRSKKELTGQVRIVEIPGGDTCACCGTHVERTGEIGLIKVLGMINYKGGVRLTMLCGGRALKDYEKKQNQVTGISNLLSAKPDAIVDAVERIKRENADKDYQIAQLYQRLFQEKANQLPSKDDFLYLFEEGLTPVLLRNYCTMLYEQKKGKVVLVCSGQDGRIQYALGSAVEDMRTLSRQLNEQFHGKGGGSALMAQGTWETSRQAVERVYQAGR